MAAVVETALSDQVYELGHAVFELTGRQMRQTIDLKARRIHQTPPAGEIECPRERGGVPAGLQGFGDRLRAQFGMRNQQIDQGRFAHAALPHHQGRAPGHAH